MLRRGHAELVASVRDIVARHPRNPHLHLPFGGLPFDTEFLPVLESTILDMPVEHQAEFADAVAIAASATTHHRDEDADALDAYLARNVPDDQDMWDAMTVANVAYLSLHAPEPLATELANLLDRHGDAHRFGPQHSQQDCVIS